MLIRTVAVFLLGISTLAAAGLSAEAAKGDMKIVVRRASPILEGRVLDLKFAGFAQGIWARDASDCEGLTTVDRARPGAVIAFFRGLMETPGEICQVYGAEKAASDSQRAAMNCRLWNEAEVLRLVTVKPRGSDGLTVEDGERPPVHYRLCRPITPVTQPVGRQASQ